MLDWKTGEKLPKDSVSTENETVFHFSVLETQIHIQSFIPQSIPCKNLLTYLYFMNFMVTYGVVRDQHKLYVTGYTFGRRCWTHVLLRFKDEVENKTEILRICWTSWILASWFENSICQNIFSPILLAGFLTEPVPWNSNVILFLFHWNCLWTGMNIYITPRNESFSV